MNCCKKMKDAGWKMWEPGWWLHPRKGGVSREHDGKWYRYSGKKVKGPYDTMLEAAGK